MPFYPTLTGKSGKPPAKFQIPEISPRYFLEKSPKKFNPDSPIAGRAPPRKSLRGCGGVDQSIALRGICERPG